MIETITEQIIDREQDRNKVLMTPTGQILLYNYPANGKTYAYFKVQYQAQHQDYCGSCLVESEPIYLSGELHNVAVLFGTLQNMILPQLLERLNYEQQN
jgi:hypothetical protein